MILQVWDFMGICWEYHENMGNCITRGYIYTKFCPSSWADPIKSPSNPIKSPQTTIKSPLNHHFSSHGETLPQKKSPSLCSSVAKRLAPHAVAVTCTSSCRPMRSVSRSASRSSLERRDLGEPGGGWLKNSLFQWLKSP